MEGNTSGANGAELAAQPSGTTFGNTGNSTDKRTEAAGLPGRGGAGGLEAGDAGRRDARREPMPMDDRAAAAAARRRAEADGRRELEALKARQESLAKSRGFGSFEEMVRYSNRELLNKRGLSEDLLQPTIHAALDAHPAVQAMRRMVDRGVLDQEMQAFRTSPELAGAGIRSVEDLLGMPDFARFYDYVARGLNFADAYALTNRETLSQRRAASARQAAMNAVNGKNHLQSAGGGADDLFTAAVPDDTLAFYRGFFPGWTDKQIREHYSKSQKG